MNIGRRINRRIGSQTNSLWSEIPILPVSHGQEISFSRRRKKTWFLNCRILDNMCFREKLSSQRNFEKIFEIFSKSSQFLKNLKEK